MQFNKIIKIEKIQSKPVYHLNVENNHNFFGNGLCLHNCDYYNNVKNEGECFVKLRNPSNETVVIPAGEAMAQAMFVEYLTTDDDQDTVGGDRVGGIGSTTK